MIKENFIGDGLKAYHYNIKDYTLSKRQIASFLQTFLQTPQP